MKLQNFYSRNSRISDWGSTIVLHSFLTFLVTFPAFLHLKSHLIGGPGGDKFQFIWNFWWVKHALLDLHQSPLYCNLQYYPNGVSLALHDMTYVWTALSIPLQFLLDPGVIFNIFLLLCFPLNGLAFYHLAKQITGDHNGALAGSIIFAYCPYLIGRFHVCHIQYLGVFFIPLFLLELWRYRQFSKTISLIKAGIYFSLTSLNSYYYGAALTFILLSFFIYEVVVSSKTKWADPVYRRKQFSQIIIMITTIGIILSPFVIPTLIQLKRGDYQSTQETNNNLEGNSGDLVAYFIPDTTLIAFWRGWFLSDDLVKFAKKVNDSMTGNRFEKSVYPGWISWVVIILALCLSKYRKKTWPWLLLALFSWIITLGPTLFIYGQPYLKGLLPCRILSMIPIINIIRGPTRFAFFITLGTGILIANGIAQIKMKFHPAIYKVISISVIIIVFLEFLPLPTSLTPNNIFLSKFYNHLQKDDGKYSILNIPADFTGATGGGDIYIFTQTIHHKPILGGHISRVPVYALKPSQESAFLRAVAHGTDKKDGALPLTRTGLSDLPETFKRFNIRYVILHKSLLGENELRRVIKWLEQGLPPPVFEDHWIRVYSTIWYLNP